MKRFVLTALLILTAASSAFATSITVQASSIENWTFGGATATIRIYATKTFTTSTAGTVIGGSTAGFYRTVNCTVAGTTLSCNSVVLDSTTDGIPNNAKYVADLYDVNGRLRTRFFDAFFVPTSLGATVTWEQLRNANASPTPVLPATYYTAEQVNAAIAGKQNLLVSGTNIKTINGNSVLGSGDLTISGVIETVVSNSTELDAVITLANASPSTQFMVALDASPTISALKTIPANMAFRTVGGFRFIKSGSGAITCLGICIADDPRVQIFSGFAAADLSWSNERPDCRPEWFGGKADNSTDNVAAVNLCLDILNTQNAGGRDGGTVLFQAGVYLFASQVGSPTTIYRNIRLKGQNMKAMSFGNPGPTVFKYTGTGSGSAYRFGAATAMVFDGIAFTYSSNSFTGIVLDVSHTASPQYGKDVRVINCYIGGYWTPSNPFSPMGAKYLLYLSGQIEAVVTGNAFVGGEAGIKMQPGLNEGGTDTNVIVIKENTFNLIRGAGILNPYQGAVIEGNNFETLNFASVFGVLPTPNGSMPWSIDYDNGYPPDAVWYGVVIRGNWFGDRVGSGAGYIRTGGMQGGEISGNFFGGGYNSYLDLGSIAGGTNTGTTLTLTGASLTTGDIGRRVWVHSQNWTGVITAILTGTTATVDTAFTSTFSSQAALATTSQVREYKANASGNSGTTLITITGVTLPVDIWGRDVWLNGTWVGKVADRTPTATTFNLDRNLPSTFTNANAQIGEWRYNASSIKVRGTASIVGNSFGGGMHSVDANDDILFEINDLSVTNGSPTVTIATGVYSPCELVGKTIEAAGGLPAEGWSVPGGTTVTAVGGEVCGGGTVAGMTRGATTMTLSNNVTVSSGQNPRRSIVRNTSIGSSNLHIAGNKLTGNGAGAQVVNPFTNSQTQSLYNTKEGGRYSLTGNSDLHASGISHDYTTFNKGYFSEDFGGGDGVIAIGNATVAPSSNPASGVIMYSQTSIPKMRTTTGVRTIALSSSGEGSLDFGSIAAGGSATLTLAATGAKAGDPATASPDSVLDAGLTVYAFVGADDVISIRVTNGSSGAIDPTSRYFTAIAFRR